MTKQQLTEQFRNQQLFVESDSEDGCPAYLSGANLQDLTLDGLDLTFADLSGANLEGMRLENVNLNYANLIGANLSYTTIEDDVSLYDTDLRRANMRHASIYGADMRKADMRNTLLSKAVFRGAMLDGALGLYRFSGAYINIMLQPYTNLVWVNNWHGHLGELKAYVAGYAANLHSEDRDRAWQEYRAMRAAIDQLKYINLNS